MKNFTLQQGQSLIVLVLMIAVVLAIVSAASYRLTTQIQSGVLQEGSVRALAAADTGIELGLKKINEARDVQPGQLGQPFETYSYQTLGITLDGIDSSRSRVIVSNNTGATFVTPEISKDSQFTFYAQDPFDTTTVALTNPITIRFLSSTGTVCGASRSQAAYEITYIYGPKAAPLVKRDLIDPCPDTDTTRIQNATVPAAESKFIDPVTFQHKFVIDPATLSNLRMVIVRSIFSSSVLSFESTGTPPIPSQGKQIRAEAYTIGGPSKIVTVFQSLPQIPAEFFVTTF